MSMKSNITPPLHRRMQGGGAVLSAATSRGRISAKCAILAAAALFAAGAAFGSVGPGFYQKLYSGSFEKSGDPETDAGNAVVEAAGLTFQGNSYTYPTNGTGKTTYRVNENSTAGYVTYMVMTAGTTYRFAKNYDDNGRVLITDPDGNSQSVIDCNSWSVDTYGNYKPSVTGWHRLDLRVGNGSGGVGPTKSPFTDLLKAGLAWTDVPEMADASCTAENYRYWKRFENVGTNCFFTGKMGVLVLGSPAVLGTPSPDYGLKSFSGVGETATFTCPAVFTNDEVTIGATCSGYRFALTNGTVTTGVGLSTSITYSVGMEDSSLTWLWDAHYKTTVKPSPKGTVTQSSADGWYDAGVTATFTATPNDDCSVFCWLVDGVRTGHGQSSLSLAMNAPHEVAALIGRKWYVATEANGGSDATGDGTAALPFLTISNGVAHAEVGDTVVVGDGLFEITTPIHVEKSITVRSANGAAKTVVKCVNRTTTDEGEVQRVFFLNDADARLEGFAITGGVSWRSSDTARNRSSEYGLGVRIDTNGGWVVSCVISNNILGRLCRGGGVYMTSERAVLTNCLVTANGDSDWSSYAAGVFINKGLVTHCTIDDNKINHSDGNSKFGAGVQANTGARLSHTKIVNNLLYGGGEGGAGININGTVVMDNCLVASNNCTSGYGGGVRITGDSRLYATNCTFAANAGALGAGGVYVCSDSNKSVFYGCVFADNTCPASSSVGTFPEIVPRNADCFYCVTTHGTLEGTGNVNDPSPLGADGLTPTLASSATDRCPAAFAGNSARDLSGNPRRSGDAIDAGCAEYQYTGVSVEIKPPSRRQVAGEACAFTVKAFVEGASKIEFKWTTDDGVTNAWTEATSASIAFKKPGTRMVTVYVRADGEELATPYSISFVSAAKIAYVVPYDADHEPVFPYLTWETAATNVADALLAAADGSSVIVTNGTYYSAVETAIDYGLTLKSVEGADKTALRIKGYVKSDKGDIPRVVLINHRDAVVSGFTLADGRSGSGWTREGDSGVTSADDGAGVLIGTAGGTLANCIVSDSICGRCSAGGGIALKSADAIVSNCVISANECQDWNSHGSIGIMTAGLIVDTTFIGNRINGGTCQYGGLYTTGGRLLRCKFVDNSSPAGDGYGAAIFHAGGTLVVEDTLFMENTGGNTYGCVYLNANGAVFTNCSFVANSAALGGGAVTVSSGRTGTFYGCLFANNVSSDSLSDEGFPEIVPRSSTFKRCYSTTALPAATSTDCASGEAVFAADGYTPSLKSAFINFCPTEDYDDVASKTDVNGKPRLSGDKVDAGCAEYQYPDVAIEIAGPSRRQCTGTDWTLVAVAVVKGATSYEYAWEADDGQTFAYSSNPTNVLSFATTGDHVVTLRVRTDGTTVHEAVTFTCNVASPAVYMAPLGDRKPAYPYATWETAATNLAQAMTAAADGTTIAAAAGEYRDCVETVIDYGATVVSTGGASVTTLRIANRKTAEKGPITRVVRLSHEEAVLDGFTVTGGVNDRVEWTDLTTDDYGAGVRIAAAGGTVRNCIITGNTDAYRNTGGGFALVSEKGVVSNCIIRANTANNWSSQAGGGYMTAGLVIDTLFERNESGGDYCAGTALLMSGGRATRCTFVGNSSTREAEAIRMSGGAMVDNCLIRDNVLKNGNGAVRLAGKATLLNCTVVGNAATETAGVGFTAASSDRVVHNCIVAGNTNSETGVACDISSTKGTVTYTLSPDETIAEGEGNVVGTPEFRGAHFIPKSNTAAHDAGSVVGYEAYLVGGRDLRGKMRVYGKAIDLGCCENQSGGMMLIVR